MPISDRKRQRFPDRVEAFVAWQVSMGLSPSVIERRLRDENRREGGWGLPASALPGRRTIARRVQEHRQAMDEMGAEPWSFLDAEPDELELLLPVQAALHADKVRPLTRTVAAATLQVRRAAPDLRPTLALSIAVEYLREPETREEIEIFLAYKPWQGGLGLERWADLLDGTLPGKSIVHFEVEDKRGDELRAYLVRVETLRARYQAELAEVERLKGDSVAKV